MGGSGRLGGRGVALRTIFQASGEVSRQQARAVSPQGRGWSEGVPALHREGFLVTADWEASPAQVSTGQAQCICSEGQIGKHFRPLGPIIGKTKHLPGE